MAAHAARRLLPMTDNLAVILGIELLVAAQGIELRAPLLTSTALVSAIALLREQVPRLEVDRYMANDLAAAASLIQSGRLMATITATLASDPFPSLATLKAHP